jgi:UDP-glucose 4-epimerase
MSVQNRTLVTGGAGFIGSHLVRRLLATGHRVIVLDDLSSGDVSNLPSNANLEFVRGTILDLDLVSALVGKVDSIYHLAEFIPNTAQYGYGHVVKFSTNNPLLDFDVNLRGTLNVIEAARKSHVKTVYTSTAAVYGETNEPRNKETSSVTPVSPYGTSKLASEMFCNLYHRIYDLPVSVVRIFNAYGPRQRKYIMYDILERLYRNPSLLEVLGNGNQLRDFIYVDDVVDALIHLGAKEAYGEVFNLGTSIPTSIKDLVDEIIRILAIHPQIKFTGKTWMGDIRSSVANIDKLQGLGYSPKTSLEHGLKEFIAWYLSTEKPKLVGVNSSIPYGNESHQDSSFPQNR